MCSARELSDYSFQFTKKMGNFLEISSVQYFKTLDTTIILNIYIYISSIYMYIFVSKNISTVLLLFN